MSNDETQRGYPLPSPDNIAYDDAKRIRDAILLINDDVTELEQREATEEHQGNVQLATAAEAAAGTALNRVAVVKRVKDMIVSAITALQTWVSEQLADLETEFDQANSDLEQAFTVALAGKVSTTAVGAGANKIVAFDANGKYPAADGSALTGLNVPDNLIVNPTFDSASVPGETGDGPVSIGGSQTRYVIEQWLVGNVLSGGGAFQVGWAAATGPAGSARRLRFTCTTAQPALGANDYVILYTVLEAVRVRSLKPGSTGASEFEIQVGFKAPAGTFLLRVGNGNVGNRYFRTSVTIAAGEANTDVVKRLIIPGDVAGSWNLSDGFASFTFLIALACGSAGQVALTGAWGASAALGVPGGFNLLSSTANVVEIFETGLWKGRGPAAYKLPDFELNRKWCERYWQTIYGTVAVAPGYSPFYFRTRMRTTPSITHSMGGAASIGNVLPDGGYMNFNETTSGYVYANARF